MREPNRGMVRVEVLVAALLLALSGVAEAVTLTIDGSQTYQVIEGFGVNANHRSWNNSELQPALDALIDQAGMTLFRVVYDNADWESANDNGDPNVMNWTYYNQVYSTADFQKMWDMSAYLNQRGITDGLMFNFQGTGPGWMMNAGNQLTPGYEAEWAEMVASAFVYARNTQHLQFSLVAPGNEEDIYPQGVVMSSGQYVTGMHTLADLLEANGLDDVRFVGPDLGYTSTDWLWAMMDDPVVMARLAHFGLHSYEDNAGGSAGIYDFLKQSPYPDRTYWMTEFNVWCSICEAGAGGTNSWAYASSAARYLLYHLANGASAGLVWEAYDSQYNYYSSSQWSYWGLLGVDNINATPKTYTPRKIFYTLAQISKFVRPGAQRIDVSPATTPPVVAFYHPGSGQLTLTGINPNAVPQTLTGTLSHLPAVTSLDLYYTDSTTNLCHGATVPVSVGSFTASLPANSVFTLVGFDPGRIAASVLITNPPDGAYYPGPATIPIQASAGTTTGTLSQVTFYCGSTNLGTAEGPPYSLVWSNVPPGTYVLSGRATNSLGNYAVSPGVRVTVVGPIAQVAVTPSSAMVVPYGTQQFTATAADALGTVINPPPAFAWEVSGGGVIESDGLFTGDGSVGGPFTVTATTSGITGTAGVSVATNFNLAPAGLGYTWYSLTASTNNSPRADAPGINDGDLNTDVPLFPGGEWDNLRAYEAAGVLWPAARGINRVVYYNGSYTSSRDGVFTSGFGLQFSPDGVTWTNAGAAWVLSPSYTYNSSKSANVAFTFTGGLATVRGVRCVGRVHPSSSNSDSWVAFATELEAFAAPVQPVGPNITAQPTNQTVLAGATATLTLAASGTAPLSYQWEHDGTNLDGATGATLRLTNVQPEQAGGYRAVVANMAGSATSTVATLTVLVLPPAITLDPTNQTVPVGATATLSVGAGGTPPLSYQWQFNGTNLDGAVADTLALTNVQPEHSGNYSVLVTNSFGAATSAAATLTVLVLPPVITLDLTNQAAVIGAAVDLSIGVSGSPPLTYQWQFNGTNLDDAVTDTLALTNVQPDQAGSYSVVVTNAAGSATSAVATLMVLVPPVITLDPTNQAALVGAAVDFTVAASGTPPLSYQWQVNGTNLDGAAAETLALTNVQSKNAGSYSAVVANAAGSATSAVATLTVLTPPAITLQPANQMVLAGAAADFTVASTGTPPLSYQWQVNGADLEGAVAPTLSLTNVQPEQAGSYRVVVTNAVGSARSRAAILSVLVLAPDIIRDPTNQAVLLGASARFDVEAGGSAPLAYQWQFNGTNLDGASTEALALTNVRSDQAGSYTAVVTNAAGAATSAVATLTIIHPPVLLDPHLVTNQAFAFTLSGDAGRTYLIEASTDLVDWTLSGTLTNVSGLENFTDPDAAGASSRFYRARLVD